MDEVMKKLDKYEEVFGESFPTFNFIHLSEEKIGKIVDECLKTNKDVYALGYAEDSMDIKY